MSLPTEPIGSIPRPLALPEAIARCGSGDDPSLEPLYEYVIRDYRKPEQHIFIGVVSPIDAHVETTEEVRDRILEAADYIPADWLGTADDCRFSPFSDGTSTSRDAAFAKIQARVQGTVLAARIIEGR